MWLTSKEIIDRLKITRNTLNQWKKDGKIEVKEINQRKFMYNIASLKGFESISDRKNVIYARVSNSKQKDDLQRQVTILKEYVVSSGAIPDVVLSEIASGMNEDRTELNKLLHLVTTNQVNKVYISYKDRLSRFGFGYFQHLFGLFGTEIVVVNLTDESDFQTELTEDLISIINHFSMKMHSNRRKALKKLKDELVEGNLT